MDQRAYKAVSLLFLLQVQSLGAVLEVGPDKPYQRVREAVIAGSVGDTVLVYPGVYIEAGLSVKKGMTLSGSGGGTSAIGYNSLMSYGEILGCPDGVTIQGLWLVGAPTEALLVSDGASVHLRNCVLSGNGGVMVNPGGAARLLFANCTIFGNKQGIVCENGSSAALSNTIVRANVQNLVGDTADISATYSNIEEGWPGEGNIDADPMFATEEKLDWLNVYPWPPSVGAIQADLRLRPDSPCIDAGFNSADLPEFDIAGMHRIMFGGRSLTVDMGAYEFYINKLDPVPGTNEAIFTWSSLGDRTYSIFYTEDLFNWHTAIANFASSGNQTTSWTDDGSLTGVPTSLVPKRFYRVLENP